MSQLDLKEYAINGVRGAAKKFCEDLEAMDESHLSECPGGTARAILDFAYETCFVNRMIADRLAGRTPAEWPWNDNWAKAPEGYAKEQAIADLRNSAEAILSELEKADADKFLDRIEVDGRQTSIFERANFAAMHMMYHDGQINYCQAMKGDLEMHWT